MEDVLSKCADAGINLVHLAILGTRCSESGCDAAFGIEAMGLLCLVIVLWLLVRVEFELICRGHGEDTCLSK